MENKDLKIKKELYGENYSQHYFDQYNIYLAGIESISDRRENANKYFVTLNSGIIVAISFMLQHFDEFFIVPAMVTLLLLGTVISIIFYFLINSYKQLNSIKFKVLHKIEKNLPIQMYADEWIALGEGKDAEKYFPFSHIERLIPIIFGAFYLIALVYFINIFLCF